MRTLIIARHGNYGPDGRLDDKGRADIARLAGSLAQYVDGGTVLILTSSADRAQESATILAVAFEVTTEVHELLWSEHSHREDLPAALKLVRTNKDKADVLILVTHFEYVESFPKYFGEHELGILLHSHLIGKGEAWVIDSEDKTLTHVR